MIEKDFDIPFVAKLALREKQIQQNYRPIIAVHKWFARRPGTLFRSLLLSEFREGCLSEIYFHSHDLRGIRVADPFVGGGTPLIEANRLGCDVVGYDINPMAYWIVREEIEYLNIEAYRAAAKDMVSQLEKRVGSFYKTGCSLCGSQNAVVKYFLWVKVQRCRYCGRDMDLFSGYLLAEDRRHPKNVFVCAECGELGEVKDRNNPGECSSCSARLSRAGPARRNSCTCSHCGRSNGYPNPEFGPPRHRMFAIEYHCPRCRFFHKGRFFKKPGHDDLARYDRAEREWAGVEPSFLPDDEIPAGDETDRLHRWGYRYYREMFNSRQLLGLELSCRAIADIDDRRVRNALATNLSDLLRYQNMLCRYDVMALKSLDIFSVHGFPVGLIQCESNLLGITGPKKGTNVGSGGWANIIEKYTKAKSYCERPFEIAYENGRKIQVATPGEWIGDKRGNSGESGQRNVALYCRSSTLADIPPASMDAVLTDPPYFANVQYAELMDFCYVWLRRVASPTINSFLSPSTRNADELTGNVTMDRSLTHFTEGLSEVFCRMTRALKPGGPLVFTYHHKTLEAYYPIAVAVLDAGLACTASIPCPAEMGASIHINGTSSSIVDTVFVCRSTGRIPRRWIVDGSKEIAELVREDIENLRAGLVIPTVGDARCIIFGHLVRLAIWRLRGSWDRRKPTQARLSEVVEQIGTSSGLEAVEKYLQQDLLDMPKVQGPLIKEEHTHYGLTDDTVSF